MLKDKKVLYFLLSIACLIFLCCGQRVKVQRPSPRVDKTTTPSPSRPPAKPTIEEPPKKPPEPAVQTSAKESRGPLVRIGIVTSAAQVNIASAAKYYLRDKTPEADRISVSGELLLGLESTHTTGPGQKVFKVQVASFPKRQEAERLKQKLTDAFSEPVSIQFNPNAQAYRVRIGEFTRRQSAFGFAADLIKGGYTQPWVVEEEGNPRQTQQMSAREKKGRLVKHSSGGFLLWPASDAVFLKVNGKSYRGRIEAVVDRGKITIVNELPMEDYLKSVVPNELPPTTFSELEALKAQAVAARTYGIKHLGRFRSDGFDLLATDRSQVYTGVALEHPLSTQAVIETTGLVLYYNNEPISALYTSTCGSRTEDYENVFGGKPVPYLRSVACAPDQTAQLLSGETMIRGKRQEPIRDEYGNQLNPQLVTLQVLGVLEERNLSHDYLLAEPTTKELQQWTRNVSQLAKRLARSDEKDDADDLSTLATFAVYLVEHLFSNEIADATISSSDADYYLANLRDVAQIPSAAKRPIAFLIQKNILLPFPDNTIQPNRKLSRALALKMLSNALENLPGHFMESGTVLRATPNSKELEIKNSRRTLNVKLSDRAYLFQKFGKQLIVADSLKIIGGEEVRFHMGGDGIDYLEVQLSRNGVANDRFSKFGRWQVSLTNEEVTKKLSALFPLGKLIDLRIEKLGASRRVIELKVVGSRGEFSLKGLKIRNALGLRDTLFTIAREHSPSEEAVGRFIFTGRGWGHGVGLCQTGAYGMALAGEKFDKILKHYYSGVQIRKTY